MVLHEPRVIRGPREGKGQREKKDTDRRPVGLLGFPAKGFERGSGHSRPGQESNRQTTELGQPSRLPIPRKQAQMGTLSIGAWRQAMNFTQRQAAQALDISLKSYQEIERGARFGSELPARADRRTELACAWLLAVHLGRIDGLTLNMVRRRMTVEGGQSVLAN